VGDIRSPRERGCKYNLSLVMKTLAGCSWRGVKMVEERGTGMMGSSLRVPMSSIPVALTALSFW